MVSALKHSKPHSFLALIISKLVNVKQLYKHTRFLPSELDFLTKTGHVC